MMEKYLVKVNLNPDSGILKNIFSYFAEFIEAMVAKFDEEEV